MSGQIIFDNKELRDYIFSFLYSFDSLIEMDNVYIFKLHKNNKNFIKLIDDYTIDRASESGSINLLKWLHYNLDIGCTEYAMDVAAERGNIEILNFLHHNRNEGCSIDALIYAADKNHLNVIEWLHQNRLFDMQEFGYMEAINVSVANGFLDITQYLYNIYIERFNKSDCFSERILNIAIRNKNLELVKWLDKKCKYYSYKETWLAGKVGNLSILKWLYQYRTKEIIEKRGNIRIIEYYIEDDRAIIFASESGHFQIVKYICEKEIISDELIIEAINRAARKGHIEIIVYLYNQYPNNYDSSVYIYAAKGGYLNIIKYIHTRFNNSKMNNLNNLLIIDAAVVNGHLHIIKWLYNNQIRNYSIGSMYNACKKGYLNIVKWLVEHKPISYGKKAMDFAAMHGHLDIVIWLYNNLDDGCSKLALTAAAGNGYLPIVEFLHNTYDHKYTVDVMNNAAMNGHLHIVKWLHKYLLEGCTSAAMNLAAKNGHLSIVKWLHEYRSEGCTSEAMDMAAAKGHLNIVKFLHENRSEGCTSDAIDLAAKNGNLLIIKYLLKHRKEGFTNTGIVYAYKHNYITVARLLESLHLY